MSSATNSLPAEYLKIWEDEHWGTLIRSTDPVVVDTVRMQFPELVPYLAPGDRSRRRRGPISASAVWAWSQDRLCRDLPSGHTPS